MVLEGHGVAWLPGSSIKEDIASKRLTVIGTSKLQMRFDVSMYRSIEKSRPQVMQFWSCVESLSEFTGSNLR
jgi:DNA-binding transcriptional LysR family regulator